MENDFLRDLQALKIKVAILKTYMSTLDQLSFAESKYFTVKDCQKTIRQQIPTKLLREEMRSEKNRSTHTPISNQPKELIKGRLPAASVQVMKEWLFSHTSDPYPSEEDKQFFMEKCGLNLNQINNWFSNARRRCLPPVPEDEVAYTRKRSYDALLDVVSMKENPKKRQRKGGK